MVVIVFVCIFSLNPPHKNQAIEKEISNKIWFGANITDMKSNNNFNVTMVHFLFEKIFLLI